MVLLNGSLYVPKPEDLVLLLDHESRPLPGQVIGLKLSPAVDHSEPFLDHIGGMVHSNINFELLYHLL